MKKLIVFFCLFLVCVLSYVCLVNDFMIQSTEKNILSSNNILLEYDAILVLGAGVENNKPSPMLEDRLKTGIELYKNGVASKMIMSGDHGREEYDEVNVMKSYAVTAGIVSSDIFMDHAGFSTYESIYRVKEIFGVQRVVIVSQKYHLYRALYLAKSLGLEAVGVAAENISYGGQNYRELREVLARNKDFFTGIFKPLPTYLGSEIPVSSNGDLTND